MAAQHQPIQQSSQLTPWHNQLAQLRHQQIAAEDRLHWMLAMREQIDSSQLTNPQTIELMIELAERISDWPMLIYLYQQNGNLNNNNQVTNTLALAQAYHQQGLLDDAANCLRSSLLSHYQQQNLADYYWHLCHCINQGEFKPQDLQGENLILTPLNEHHLNAFCWNYYDPKIAALCNLPEFTSDQQWQDWLYACQSEDGHHVFAVNHSEWGFIGSVSIEIYDGIGFFYYWLGADFQGHGFGPQAVDLLLNVAVKYCGLDCCYAKVFDHNTPSQKAMQKLGFTPLDIAVEPPYDNEWLYYLGPEKTRKQYYADLHWLFSKQQSSMWLEGEFKWFITGECV